MPASLVAGHGRVSLLTPDGELLELTATQAVATLRGMAPPLVVHAPSMRRRLGIDFLPALDLLERRDD